jgi:hypothetical protein
MAVDQIGTKALVDCSVAAADIAPGTITSAKLAGSIANAKLSNSSITVNGTTIALGASGAVPPVQWQSVVVSDGSTVTTMVAGRGYFVNNTSAAGIVKLPASATAGDIVSIKDYAGNFGTNNLTIQRNGHNIQGNAVDSEISTNRASVTLVYVDATKGWLYTNESNVGNLTGKYVTATGGTVTTSGNDKIHTFTGDSNFVVSCGGNVGGSNKVSYFVLGGGGGGGAPQSSNRGGGGGGGGFREGKAPAFNSYTSSPSPIVAPDGLAVPAATYPITVGGGGNGGTGQANVANPGQIGTNGSASIFSTITSAGGGGGGGGSPPSTGTIFPGQPGGNGGGGGGGGTGPGTCARGGGEGNTPPVSPSQGSKGGAGGNHPGNSSPPDNAGGGGGGISARGGSTRAPAGGGHGGDGATTEITASSVAYGGGGAGIGSCSDGNAASGGIAAGSNGTANRGMGGPPGSAPAGAGKNGGSGIVVIRYKYQN